MQRNPHIISAIRKLRREKRGEMLMQVKKQGIMTAGHMKEKKVDVIRIIDFDIKEDKVFGEADGHDYPMKGFPDGETVMVVCMYKRLLPLMVESILKQNWLSRIITVISLFNNRKIADKWFGYIFTLGYYLLKDEYWQESTKEIRRTLSKHFEPSIVDAISLVYEYDDGYRYPAQDVLSELQKANLTGFRGTRREILRLADIYIERAECNQDHKLRKLKKVLGLALLIPKINKLAKEVLLELDIDKVKFDECDKYWVSRRKIYKYNI